MAMNQVNIDKINKAIKGDGDVFAELIKERKDPVYRLAYTYVRDSNEALNILQEVTYKAFISIKSLKHPEFFNTWLTKVTINVCINYLKKKNKVIEKGREFTDNIIDSRIDETDIIANLDLFDAIEKLDINLKTIIILKYFEGILYLGNNEYAHVFYFRTNYICISMQ